MMGLVTTEHFERKRVCQEFWKDAPWWTFDDGRKTKQIPFWGDETKCQTCGKQESDDVYLEDEVVKVMLWTGSDNSCFPSTSKSKSNEKFPSSYVRVKMVVRLCDVCGPRIFTRMDRMNMGWHAFVSNDKWYERPDVFAFSDFDLEVIEQLKAFTEDDYMDEVINREDLMYDTTTREYRQLTEWKEE